MELLKIASFIHFQIHNSAIANRLFPLTGSLPLPLLAIPLSSHSIMKERTSRGMGEQASKKEERRTGSFEYVFLQLHLTDLQSIYTAGVMTCEGEKNRLTD